MFTQADRRSEIKKSSFFYHKISPFLVKIGCAHKIISPKNIHIDLTDFQIVIKEFYSLVWNIKR